MAADFGYTTRFFRYLNLLDVFTIRKDITLSLTSLFFSFDIPTVPGVYAHMNTVLKNSSHGNFTTQRIPTHEPWLERLLDRAVALRGKRRFWTGVWVKRFRAFCHQEDRHVGMEVIPLAKAFLKRVSKWNLEDWQIDQATEALRLFVREIEHWRWLDGEIRFRLRSGRPVRTLATAGPRFQLAAITDLSNEDKAVITTEAISVLPTALSVGSSEDEDSNLTEHEGEVA